MIWRLALVQCFVAVVAFFGAIASKAMRDAGGVYSWLYFGTGILGILSWMLTAKVSPYNLLVSSIVWDVVYNSVWIGTAVFFLKESSSVWQVVGAGVVALGLALMAL